MPVPSTASIMARLKKTDPATGIHVAGLTFASAIAAIGHSVPWIVTVLCLMILFGGAAAIAERSKGEADDPPYGPWLVTAATLIATYGVFRAGLHVDPTSDPAFAALKGVIALPFGIALITRFRDSRSLVALQIACGTAILCWAGADLRLTASYALAGGLLLTAWPILLAWVPDRQSRSSNKNGDPLTRIVDTSTDAEPMAPC